MKIKYYCFVAAFVFILIILGGMVLFTSDSSFSRNENRILQTAPDFSISAMLDGSFQNELLDYMNDQFPMRDDLMAAGTKIKRLTGRNDINGTYIGSDGYYFEKVTEDDINYERYVANLIRIENFAKKYSDSACSVMFVPSSGIVLEDKLPAHAKMYDYETMIQTARNTFEFCAVVDVASILNAHKDDYIYYKTDHHWTAYGAYLAYTAYLEEEEEEYNAVTVSDTFRGTLYSKTLDSESPYDSISLPNGNQNMNVIIDGKVSQLYDRTALDEKDQYKVFFGGNFGQIELEGEGEGTLLVIKDSFANCFVPYLTKHYKKIIMIDLRYFSSSVSSLINSEQDGSQHILFLYEINNFASDSNLAKLALLI